MNIQKPVVNSRITYQFKMIEREIYINYTLHIVVNNMGRVSLRWQCNKSGVSLLRIVSPVIIVDLCTQGP
jgi:hypothetical protein